VQSSLGFIGNFRSRKKLLKNFIQIIDIDGFYNKTYSFFLEKEEGNHGRENGH
tara:strand:- start:722 stop:880 length:159 start_codon:yes stop_codon:yes gene_type:complete